MLQLEAADTRIVMVPDVPQETHIQQELSLVMQPMHILRHAHCAVACISPSRPNYATHFNCHWVTGPTQQPAETLLRLHRGGQRKKPMMQHPKAALLHLT